MISKGGEVIEGGPSICSFGLCDVRSPFHFTCVLVLSQSVGEVHVITVARGACH